jgi:hypothetical protein
MAGVLRDAGREDESRRHLREFLTLAPESPWASLAAARLDAARLDAVHLAAGHLAAGHLAAGHLAAGHLAAGHPDQ